MMHFFKFVIPIFIIILKVVSCQSKGQNVVCYFLCGYGLHVAPPELLDGKLCTHLNYAFVKVDGDGNLAHWKKSLDIDKRMFEKILSLKKANKKLKVLISLGETPPQIFSQVAADSTKRQKLVTSSVNFLKKYGFDGIDVDWEHPNIVDKENFIHLLAELKLALKKDNYLLTVALQSYPTAGYNTTAISENVDMINLMCYVFYGRWSKYTGHNSALFGSSLETEDERNRRNTAACLQNWLKAGAVKDKINIGMPFYGRIFNLADPNNHELHSLITGVGNPETLTYRQICLNYTNYTTVWSDEQKISYKYFNNQWMSFENEQSIMEKAKYIKSQNVAGAMIWQIGQDDINGECGQKQSLLRTVNQYLLNN
ncbi:unnamed protein product [Diabrotica balteata]|uniref:GH18 domain-containing protein n=1 Tax=Diabrotica balteata TaxID=107213 RepID=A0A9N9XC70_DIABA|nr:unnamed protein product [Diabrotica balteata]